MKTALRWLAGIAAGIVVAALALALVAAWWFDGDALKKEIESRVERQTGLALSISGDLSLSLIPRPGVEVGHAALANAPAFGGGNMAELDALSLKLRLTPLLGGSVVTDAVVVEGLKLRLVRNASGRHNYEALLAPDGGSAEPPAALLAIGGLRLNDAALSYEDRTSGETFRITGMNFQSGPLSVRRPVPLAAQFRFDTPARGIEGDASVEAELSIHESLERFAVDSLLLTADVRGAEVPGGDLQLRWQGGALRYDAAARMLSLQSLDITAIGAGLGDTPARLRVPRAAADLAAGTASMEGFSLRALELDVAGDLSVNKATADPALTGSVRVAPFDPRALLSRLGGPPAETGADGWPTQARLESGLSGDGDRLTLDPIALSLNGTRVSGRIEIGLAPKWPLTVALRAEGLRGVRQESMALTLRGSGRAGEEASSYRFSDLELRLGALTVRGEVQARAAGDGREVIASMEVPDFDGRALLASLGLPLPQTADAGALTRVAARAELSGGGADLLLDPLTLELDDTKLAGSIRVSDAFSGSPAVRFALDADTLDTRRYLPFTLPGSEPGAGPPASLAVLRGLDLNGRLRFGTLVLGDVTLDKVELSARSRDGRLELRSDPVPPTPTSAGRTAASEPPPP